MQYRFPNQNTTVIPGIYVLSSPLGWKLNALRNSLMRCLCAKRYHKAMQVCEHALRLQPDPHWVGVRNTLEMVVSV